ncbi:MAG TPA: zinc ribbon domain-containing protein [Candidatus Angelobacter sp.]|nr:zinc ribbon domain-containing protein [Candidatus Angelobacter sp.]
MLCTFCGTENRPEHKFCGMCGVRLERRKEQRRGRQISGNVTCQACGHVNDTQTKFCGMCGVRVDRRSGERRISTTPDVRAQAIANAQLPTPDIPGQRTPTPVASLDVLAPPPADELEARRAAEAIFHSRPSPPQTTIGGPSFLGLSNDTEIGPSQYLLEDEAPSGAGRGMVFLVILIILGGLGYMGYRSGYFSSLQAATASKKQAVPAPVPTPLASPDVQAAASPTPEASPEASAAASSIPPLPGQPKTDQPAASASDESSSADAPDNTPASDAAGAPAKAAKEMPPPAKRKPSAALIQAQNYLQGRGGVRQDCDQGLIYLKAATEKNDPAAAVQMGALYASGHCVQQDRVMAYRWFNSAHELDPANPWIQTNLDQLWAQMSPQERNQIAR